MLDRYRATTSGLLLLVSPAGKEISECRHRLVPSTSFKVVCLFSLLGLTVSAVLRALIAPDRLAWILSHIE